MRGLHPEDREKTIQEIKDIVGKMEYVDGYTEKILEDFNNLCNAFDKMSSPALTEDDRTEILNSYQKINEDFAYIMDNGYASEADIQALEDLAVSFSGDGANLKMQTLDGKTTIYDIEIEYNKRVAEFNRISSIKTADEEASKEIVDTTAKAVMEALGQNGKHDDMRYMNKAMLLTVARNYEKYLDNMKIDEKDTILQGYSEEIKTLITDIRAYATIDATIGAQDPNSEKNYVERERRLFEKIYSTIDALDTKVQEQSIDRDEKDVNYNDISRITSNLLMYFEGQRNGNLTPVPKSEITVDSTGMKISRVDKSLFDTDIKQPNAPLFPHDPSYNDIKQGALGDCYLVSSLSAIALSNADQIKEAMVDNGDGTVTVRFWQKSMGKDGIAGKDDTYTPIYVKVDKVTPEAGAAQGCVWVQTLERAYAASGLSMSSGYSSDSDAYRRPAPKPEELEKMYNDYSKLPRHELPSHAECPWLIDEKGNLHKYQPEYKNIDGGNSGIFIEHFLGKRFMANQIDMDDFGKHEPEPLIGLDEILVDMCKEANFFDNQLEIKQFAHDLKFSGNNIKYYETVYKLVCGDKNAKLPLNDGMLDLNDENALVAYSFVSDINEFFDKVARPEIKEKTRESLDMTGMSKYMMNLKADKNDPLLQKHLMIFGNDNLKNKYGKIMFKVEDKFKDLHTQFKAHPKYDGVYNGKEKELYDNVKRALKNKKPVTLSTHTDSKSTGDRRKLNGMNYKHAYTVMDVVEKEINGKNLLFLKVRNPHALTGRNYGVQNGKTVAYEDANSKEGECLIEISDVIDECSKVTISQYTRPDRMPSGVEHPVTEQDISKYLRCIESVSDLFNTKSTIFGKDSDEYVKAQKAITALKVYAPDYLGKDMSELANLMQTTDRLMDKYLQHCAKEPNNTGTRAKRMEAANAFRQLYKDARQNIKDPNQAMKEKTALTVTKKLMEINKKDATPEQIKANAEKLMQSKEFKNSYGKGNYMQMYKVNTMDPIKITKSLVEFSKQLNAPKVQAPQAGPNVQKAPEKQVSNDAPQKQDGGMAMGH